MGWADLVIFSAVLTTLCRAFWSAEGQLPYQTEQLLVRMLSITHPCRRGGGHLSSCSYLFLIKANQSESNHTFLSSTLSINPSTPGGTSTPNLTAAALRKLAPARGATGPAQLRFKKTLVSQIQMFSIPY